MSPDDNVGVYVSPGIPEPEIPGGCQVLIDGHACRNPGRHRVNGLVTCTTHRKALERSATGGLVDGDSETLRTFERDMVGIYDKAKAAGYNATRFLVMVRENGGLETAHRLLDASDVSYGFTELWMLGRHDLTVEALVLQPQYAELFSEVEKQVARDRLGDKAPPNPGTRRWTVTTFEAAASRQGGVNAAVIARFVRWARVLNAADVGEGPSGPLYFSAKAADDSRVPLISIDLAGVLTVLFNDLVRAAPFNELAQRIELQRRLNQIVGIDVRDEVVETATWQSFDGAYLLSPGAFDQLAEAYEWAARQISSAGAPR